MIDAYIRNILADCRSIAVIGAKDTPGQPVDRVGRYLIAAGYDVIPVHPVRTRVWGRKAHPRLADISQPVEIVNVFRAPEFCFGHAHEALALSPRPRLFWMQLGIENAEARSLLAPAGITVVQNACLMVEHAALFG